MNVVERKKKNKKKEKELKKIMERKERNDEEENKWKLVEQVGMNVVKKERKKGLKTEEK